MRFLPHPLFFTLAVSTLLAQAPRDSAGIRIVDNARPALARPWRVETKPLLDIGGLSGDSLYELHDVAGVARLRDGRIVVANGGTSSIRFYNGAGKFLRAVGRAGRGPGEFTYLRSFFTLANGELLAVDGMGVKYFSASGEYLREGHRRGRGSTFVQPSVVFPDGSFLGFDDQHLVFGPRAQFASAGDGFYFGFPDRYEISQYSRALRLTRIMRKSALRVPVPSEAITEYKRRLPALLEGGNRTDRERYLANLPFAERLPAFSQLLVDRAGHLWAQMFQPWEVMPDRRPIPVRTGSGVSKWDVFDPGGRWLCTVTIPASFTPLDIGTDWVAGLWRDPDEVEHVQVYQLVKR